MATSPVVISNTTPSPSDSTPMSQKYYYPPVHALQRPQASYASHIRRESKGPRADGQRLQSSISSEGSSGSTSMSMMKTFPHPDPFWHASNMERGLGRTDKEKSVGSWSSPTLHKPSNTVSNQEMVENNAAVFRYIEEQRGADSEEDNENDHAVWILFWISCLDPIHSMISALYTLLVVFTLVLVSPVRFCRTQSSFGDQIIRILAPIFRNHLEMMYAPSVEDAFAFDFSPARLVVVHLTSPVVSLGMMTAGWVSAIFWLLSLMMGNPDGTERHDDGRDTVLHVRHWWEIYLLHALRDETRL